MNLREKQIDRLNDAPPAKRERKGHYYAIVFLAGCVLALAGDKVRSETKHATELQRKDQVIAGKDSANNVLNVKLQACEAEKVTMERDFRDEVYKKVEQAKGETISWIDGILTDREQRLQRFQKLNAATIPALLRASKESEKFHQQVQKIP